MNEIIQSLYNRKSVRVFEERPVSRELKAEILRAAVQAPSAGCQQLYTILDMTDAELKAALAETCDNQPFIASAPIVLVFCADCKKWYDAYRGIGCQPRRPGVGDLLLAVSDTLIAAQNAVVAAESLGLGSCYIGDVTENCERQRELMHLPDYVFPAALLVMGWPTAQQKARPKPPRSAMEHIVHENTYRAMDDNELRAMLAPNHPQKSYEDWLRAFCARKYDSAFSHEMTRSVAEYLRQFEH